MSDSTTYFEAPLMDADMFKTIEAAKPEAAKRLGGADGLRLVTAHLKAGDIIAMTWSRHSELAAADAAKRAK